jgi:hypothetical protein
MIPTNCWYVSLFFLRFQDSLKGESKMKSIQFTTLEEVFDCYGRENLIPIDNLSQIIEYTKHGCQPKFIYESEVKPGKLTGWFLRSESAFVYKKWMESHPPKRKQ